MTEKILNINLRRLKDGQFVEFMVATQAIFTPHAQALKLEFLLEGYGKALGNLEDAYKRQKMTLYTQKIVDLDEKRDRALLKIYYFLKAMLHEPDNSPLFNAAQVIMSVFSLYGAAKMVRKDYNQESAIIDNLLRDIQTQYPQEAKLLDIDKSLQNLAACNEDFKKNYDIRGEQMQANDMLFSMYQARSQAINIYLSMVRQVHAAHLIAAETATAKKLLITRLNEEIKKYLPLTAKHQGPSPEEMEGM